MSKTFILKDNGDRVYKKDPPDYLEGYTQDEMDPFLFHLDYLPCVYHEENKVVRLACGKFAEREYCSLKEIVLTPLKCKNCSSRKQFLESEDTTLIVPDNPS